MYDTPLLTYSLIVFLLTITPGSDTMLVFRNVISSGRQTGIITTLGISTGLLFYAFLTAFGLATIVVNSPLLFQIMKTAGAIYLLFLGIQSLISLSKKSFTNLVKAKHHLSVKKAYGQGFFSNFLNPKIIVFYLTFLPQFIAPHDNIFVKSFFLTGIHITLNLIWLTTLSMSIGSIKFLYTSPKIRHITESVSGLALITFALILLLKR